MIDLVADVVVSLVVLLLEAGALRRSDVQGARPAVVWPLFALVSLAAASPGIIMVIPTVVVLVVAALLHHGLRGWARQSLSDDGTAGTRSAPSRS